jgi:tripartite-type tricarboxylate transporter receptor subunit TctC
MKMTRILSMVFAMIFSICVYAQPTNFDPAQRPIEIIVPFPPGGSSDSIARLMGEMFNDVGWKAVVITKTGGASIVASNYVANSKPDGHTLLMAANAVFDQIATSDSDKKLSYNENSFAPIIPMGTSSYALTMNGNVQINSYEEFKNYVRKNPEKFNVGFWNPNTAKLFAIWAEKEKLPAPNVVTYKGSAQMQLDLFGDNITFIVDSTPNLIQHLKSNKVKIFAVLDSRGEMILKRHKSDTKVFVIGQKYPELDVAIWHGVYAPAGTDPEVIAKINEVLNKGLKNPKYSENIDMLHLESPGGSVGLLDKRQKHIFNIIKTLPKDK